MSLFLRCCLGCMAVVSVFVMLYGDIMDGVMMMMMMMLLLLLWLYMVM